MGGKHIPQKLMGVDGLYISSRPLPVLEYHARVSQLLDIHPGLIGGVRNISGIRRVKSEKLGGVDRELIYYQIGLHDNNGEEKPELTYVYIFGIDSVISEVKEVLRKLKVSNPEYLSLIRESIS